MSLEAADASAPSDSFTFPESSSIELRACLLQSFDRDGGLFLQLFGTRFCDVYQIISENVLNHHLTILQFSHLLLSRETERMAETIAFLTLSDSMAVKAVFHELTRRSSSLFLCLASQSESLKRRLTLFSMTMARTFVEFWSAGICATILTLLLRKFSDSAFARTPQFYGHIERSVRQLLIGFSPSTLDGYHGMVEQLIPAELRVFVPATLVDMQKPAKTRKQTSERDFFAKTAQTALATKTRIERGSFVPFPPKRHGNGSDLDDGKQFSIAKALRIGQNIRELIETHERENEQVLKKLTQTESDYMNNLRIPGVKPLGVTFETFNPVGGGEGAARSARRRRSTRT